MKWLIKMCMPKPETLAKWAADAVKKAVADSGKQDVIAKYASLCKNATEIANYTATTLSDGLVDESERDDIAKMLEPLFQKLMELI